MQCFLHCVWPPKLRFAFLSYFYQQKKAAVTQHKITILEKKLNLLQTTYKVFLNTYQPNAKVSFIVFGLQECIFDLFYSPPPPPNSVVNTASEKKIKSGLEESIRSFATIPGHLNVSFMVFGLWEWRFGGGKEKISL